MTRITSLARIALFAAAAFALVMASLPQPPQLPGAPSDKVQHIIAFLTLGALAALAFPTRSIIRLCIALGLFGGVIELVQMIPALNRDASWLDLAADMGAAIVSLALMRIGARALNLEN